MSALYHSSVFPAQALVLPQPLIDAVFIFGLIGTCIVHAFQLKRIHYFSFIIAYGIYLTWPFLINSVLKLFCNLVYHLYLSYCFFRERELKFDEQTLEVLI